MSIQPFQIEEHEFEPGCLEIQIAGELDLAVAEQLKDALTRADEESKVVLICLGGCEFIDSSGIAAIVRAHNRFADAGRTLVVHSAADQVLRTLTVTGLTSNGLLFETREEALSAVEIRPEPIV